MIFFYSEVNRLKQQLLVASHRLKMTYIGEKNLNSIEEIPDKVALALESKAGENVSDDYKIENANDFVLTMASDEWQFTEPYAKSDRERLMECLYRFVESMVTLEQFIKVFDDESSSISVGHSSIKSFAKQNAAKTYFDKNTRAELESEENAKDYKKRLNPLANKINRVFWFIDEDAYEELGEEVLKMVLLIESHHNYKLENYTPNTIYQNLKNVEIKILSDKPEFKDAEILNQHIAEQRHSVLMERLYYAFVSKYPQFEFELKFFFNSAHGQMRNKLINTYLDSIAVHHHHYFPSMPPIGHAHQSCNIITYTRGFPTPHIYVHNLINYDSDFLLKMLPPDIMAHKGKNTAKQWSVISPDGNKHKIKMLITPFGIFSDSMNFFASSLSAMADQMNERDIQHLYQLHLNYFQNAPNFKKALKKREEEGHPFSYAFFKDTFKGKLIFPYEDMDDIDWTTTPATDIPCIESFMKNKLGKSTITEDQYNNMSRIFKYFECQTLSDLLHIYTLEDGMLLAVIMSNTFQDMYESLGLDPTNFASTAKYSYIACKRLMNLNMQTIPNGRIFHCITEMKRAGFSMVKKQVSIASPLNDHTSKCQYSPDCKQCSQFVKVIEDDTEVKEIALDIKRVSEDCKVKLEKIKEDLCSEMKQTGSTDNEELVNIANQLETFYDALKSRELEDAFDNSRDKDDKEIYEHFLALQTCLFYYDENNQYGRALKQILPVGNYAWNNTANIHTLTSILNKQKNDLLKNPKARVVDFYACVNIELPKGVASDHLTREEEFNLLVKNETPNVFNYTEKMLRVKRQEYARKPGKYKAIPTYKKLMSGTKPMFNYWIHSAILNMALKNGWVVTKVLNTITFTAQKVCEPYIQFNQDERMKYIKLKREFMGLFHKLMNNGFYGWFCRAVEKYKQTDLLFSSQSSYEYFEKCSQEFCSGKALEERALFVIQNPHDNKEDKIDKIEKLFETQIKIAEKTIERCENFIRNITLGDVYNKTEKKIKSLKKYVTNARVGRAQAISTFKVEEELKELMIAKKRIECEKRGKRFYQIPNSQLPVNKSNIKSREEVMSTALKGKLNKNSSVVLFNTDNGKISSICFGMLSTTRPQTIMRSKNDVAVSVLSHAKARIGEFYRLISDCLPSRFRGLSIHLMMTDTDSLALQASYPLLLKRNKVTKAISFKNEQDKKTTLSALGSDVMKEHLQSFLCCAPEMCNIIDRAHYKKDSIYFDGSRKKQVGLYTDETPLPKLITSFQCVGPKNYQFKTLDLDEEEGSKLRYENKSKHKGIPKKLEVTEDDYTRLIMTWDRQFNLTQSIKDYTLQDRRNVFSIVEKKLKDELTNFVNSQADVNSSKKKKNPTSQSSMTKVKNSAHLTDVDSKLYESHSFYTTQLMGSVFLTKVAKRLGLSPSDKVLYPRHSFVAYSFGSRFGEAVKKFNQGKEYDEIFTDVNLFKQFVFETDFLNNMERFYHNGVRSTKLIKIEEEIDYNVCMAYLEEHLKRTDCSIERKKTPPHPSTFDRNVDGDSEQEENE